jgi:N-hydroxyarylamine O-acetyltransferase
VTILRGNEKQAMRLADRPALRALLVDHFGFDLPEVERLRVPTIREWD